MKPLTAAIINTAVIIEQVEVYETGDSCYIEYRGYYGTHRGL